MTARHWGIVLGVAAVAWAALGESTAAAVLSGFSGLVMALAAIHGGA